MAVLSLNQILKNRVLESLQGSENILVKTIMDLSADVQPGMDRVQIPNVTGLALRTITPGTRQTAGGMTQSSTTLLLDQVKEVPEYLNYGDDINSAIPLKAAFIKVAPGVYARGLEELIADKIATASANDFESESATAGKFTINDIAKAKRYFDKARIPASDRFLGVNAEGMEVLASMQEFQDGSKSLSAEALRMGVVSQVKGFMVVQSEDLNRSGTGATLKVHCWHRSSVAFAMHDGLNFIASDIPEYAQEFVALRGKYGCVDVDNADGDGVRKLTISCTTATS